MQNCILHNFFQSNLILDYVIYKLPKILIVVYRQINNMLSVKSIWCNSSLLHDITDRF